ncbi:hypothetical protein GGX14DRAFT_525763 [Mycena pura]|uniref:SET domain-containing protein n=1 Tax=Mycena pura TaxID=153505 RepID=A0AAD6UZR5_9AGAR|nr:hypothetical protein GGX14DRAFT_525763 [Mycena pura]
MTITTLPLNAKESTECFFFPGVKEYFTRLPGFPHPLQRPTKPAHRLVDLPGKGKAVFSTRALAQGELILSERPLLIRPSGMTIPTPPTFTREQFFQHQLNGTELYLEHSVNRMSPERKAAFMALANSHKEDGSGPLMGITRTNSIGLPGLRPGVKEPEEQHSAVCNEISRLNHSCSANTNPIFDKYSLSYRLYAVRDIAAGEELTFQYINTLSDAAKRQESLKPYDFVCTCTACTEPTAESDARRAAICGFTPTVMMWAIKRELSDDWLIEKCREQLALIEQEGLEHVEPYCAAVKAIMEAYICLGDTAQASKWAAKVNKCVWADNYQSVENLLDPASPAYKKHPMWRMRLGQAPPGFGKMFQDFAALAGEDGVKMLPGGAGIMMFPMPAGMPKPPFPFPSRK